MKRFGYGGVILGYAKEFVSQNNSVSGAVEKVDRGISEADLKIIERWKQGTLQTLRCLDQGDFLAIKYVWVLLLRSDKLISVEVYWRRSDCSRRSREPPIYALSNG